MPPVLVNHGEFLALHGQLQKSQQSTVTRSQQILQASVWTHAGARIFPRQYPGGDGITYNFENMTPVSLPHG